MMSFNFISFSSHVISIFIPQLNVMQIIPTNGIFDCLVDLVTSVLE